MTTRRSFLGAAAAGMVAATTGQGFAAPAATLRVGFQKGEPILLAAKQNRNLETLLQPLGVGVAWFEFEFGPPMLEAMRAGSVDIGAVGDTPPVFAQASRADLLYVAAQRSGGQAILVPPGSTLHTLQDLKGKKVAFGRGSSAHELLLQALEKAGLTYSDIQPVYLGPADAGPAFERGAIDAWSIWDPYYALFESRPGVRVLAKWTEIGEQNSFFVGRRSYVEQNGAVIAKVVGEFARIAAWGKTHRADVAALLAAATGMPSDAVRRAVDRTPFAVLPVDAEITANQQKVADRFYALGLIPARINVAAQVWRAGA